MSFGVFYVIVNSLTIEQFGYWALINGFALALVSIASLSLTTIFDGFYFSKNTLYDNKQLLHISFLLISVVIYSFVGLILFFISFYTAYLFNFDIISITTLYISLSFFNICEISVLYHRNQKAIIPFSIISCLKPTLLLVGMLVLYNTNNIDIPDMINVYILMGICCFVLTAILNKDHISKLDVDSLKIMTNAIRRGLILLPRAVPNQILINMDKFILSNFIDDAQVGLYAIFQKAYDYVYAAINTLDSYIKPTIMNMLKLGQSEASRKYSVLYLMLCSLLLSFGGDIVLNILSEDVIISNNVDLLRISLYLLFTSYFINKLASLNYAIKDKYLNITILPFLNFATASAMFCILLLLDFSDLVYVAIPVGCFCVSIFTILRETQKEIMNANNFVLFNFISAILLMTSLQDIYFKYILQTAAMTIALYLVVKLARSRFV